MTGTGQGEQCVCLDVLSSSPTGSPSSTSVDDRNPALIMGNAGFISSTVPVLLGPFAMAGSVRSRTAKPGEGEAHCFIPLEKSHCIGFRVFRV